jgi:ribosomal protein S13
MRDLAPPQILELNAYLDSLGKIEETKTLKIENELKREILRNIQRLRDTGTYRGRRHAMNLPVRGQNTKSQIKTGWRLNKVDRHL